MFPFVAQQADELAVVRSITTPVNEHAQGNFFIHSGFPTMGYPSAGAWSVYGLGSENQDLPGYVVLQSGGAVPPHGGVALFSNGFLPAQHQGSILKADAADPTSDLAGKQEQPSADAASALPPADILVDTTQPPAVGPPPAAAARAWPRPRGEGTK